MHRMNPGAFTYGDIPLWTEDEVQVRRLLVHDAALLAEFYCGLPATEFFNPHGDSMTALVAQRIYVESFRGEREDVVALRHARIVGWVFLRPKSRCAPWELSLGIAVSPAMRGGGIGERLLEKVEERARKRGLKSIRLIAAQANKGAIHFYRKHGFEQIEAFKANGEPHIAMRKILCE